MTFEEFQATRQWSDDLATAVGFDFGSETPLRGYHYASGLHIFALADDRYELVIFNDVTVSSDLGSLERKIYAFGSDEGQFE